MFVFSRRAMQRMLDAISPWMPEKSLKELIARLNRPHENRLPQMWELAMLYGLGSVVQVEHEQPLPNGKPDFLFSIPVGDRSIPVVGDVTTLSDTQLDRVNGFDQLTDAIRKLAHKAGLPGGGFHLTVSHLEPWVSDTGKVQLLIPSGPAFEQLIKRRLKPFVKDVAESPQNPHFLKVDEDGAKFLIEYKGPSNYSGGSYRCYDGALALENNVLFNRLRDKTSQLRGAPKGAVRILVVCDGDCAVLGRPRPMEGFSAQQIAESFLRGSQTIDLVLLIGVIEESKFGTSFGRVRKLQWSLVSAPTAARPEHLTEDVLAMICAVLDRAIASIPTPVMMPNNSLRRNLDSTWSGSMVGAMKSSGNKIKISSRAVLELLAGVQTYEEFASAHGWNEGEFNMFESRIKSGQLFKSARIDSLAPDMDDDWLEFEFGPPDSAVSPFRLPVESAEGNLT